MLVKIIDVIYNFFFFYVIECLWLFVGIYDCMKIDNI